MVKLSSAKLGVPFSGLALEVSLSTRLGVAAAQPDLGPLISTTCKDSRRRRRRHWPNRCRRSGPWRVRFSCRRIGHPEGWNKPAPRGCLADVRVASRGDGPQPLRFRGLQKPAIVCTQRGKTLSVGVRRGEVYRIGGA